MKRSEQTYKKRFHLNQNIRTRIICLFSVIWLFFLLSVNHAGGATWPPSGNWPVWGGQPANITPVAWPADANWVTYTSLGSPLADPAIADPSNGGTSPQNYVSVTSNCPDKTLPSVYWYFDAANQVIFFRFRLAAIPNTYATGPSAGAASTTDAWRSGQWSVLIDIDGDGYREFAMHLDGSTGVPGNPIDRLSIIYSATQNNSLDYNDPGASIYLVNQFPAAFVNIAGGLILNFHNSSSPDTNWPNGSAETVWDYGMTRCTNGSTPGCVEYIADYQIPLAMLDASAVGGPVLDENTPMSFLFTTANSLQNPFQKDVVTTGDETYIGNSNEPGPFGDPITPGGGTVLQAAVVSVTASGCGPVSLSAEVNDAIIISGGNAVTSVTAVEFYYYEDTNGNGIEDDANTWTLIGSGSTTNNPIGTWTASWDSTSLVQGSYLIGAKAINGQGNITWSWVAPADIGLIGPTPPNYANPPDPGQTYATFYNICGAPPPYAVKTSNALGPLSPGDSVTFTITVYNTGSSPLNVSTITDPLPSGFTYQSTVGGTLGAPSSSPTAGDTGVLTWTFPPASVPAGANRTLIFTCTAPTTAGTYSNSASVQSSVGTLDTEPTQVSVGSPQLTITKSASAASVAPGDTLIYTIGYANTSPVNVTGVAISEPLPDGVTYVSNTGGGVYNGGTRMVSWSIGNLAAGESGTVTVTVTVDNPFPAGASIPMVNTANLTSNESGPTSASSSVFVSAPRPILAVQKSAASSTVAENTDVTFTILYANTGTAAATSLTLTDPVPSGLTFVSATGGGTYSGGTVTWNLPDLAPNTTGSVTVTLHVPTSYAGANPLTNTVSLSATGVSPVTDSFRLGVNQTTNICNTYYFTNTTDNVGADGVQYIANTTAPSGSGTNLLTTLPSWPSTPVPFTEITRFYSPPASSSINFAGDLTTTYWVDRANGNPLDVRVTVYDYDTVTGTKNQLGTNTVTLGGSSKGMQWFTITMSGTLANGHRLLWLIEGAEQQKNKTDDIYFQFGGTVTNPISGGMVNATSNGAVCFVPPANLIINKQVDQLTAGPGATLAYTILFSNTGQIAAAGAQITDTLPSGVTYVSATLNGAATTPASVSGQVYTFNVNSSDTGTPGQVTGGQSGVLEITVTIDSPLANGIDTLLNSASLVSTQTAAVTDTASTTVLRPDVTVSKSANLTLVGPGDTVTYTYTIINSGSGAASNVTLNDVLPVQTYYNYVPGSTTLNGAPAADNVSGGTLNFNVGTLAAGQVAVVTLQMAAGAAGTFPATQTNLSNTAAVSDDETSDSRTSNTVTVTINPLPNLTISKSLNPAGPYGAGDTITCEISISNDGGSDAFGVTVTDNIPSFTNYKIGFLVYNGSPQTDTPGDDTGSFDSPGNRVVFQVGTLASGASRTMSFQVIVQYPMITGTSILSNTAQVTAVNAATKSDTVTGTITAAPVLSVTKLGPSTSPFPAAAVTASSSGTTVQVDDVSPFIVSQYIRVATQNRKITGISGNTLTVDSAITVTNGDAVTGSISYSLQYANNGTANAAGTTLVDTLPAGAIYVESTGGGVYAAGPGTVTWSLGTLPVGGSGSVQVTIFPGSVGNAVNSATITATGATPASDSFTTGVGGLRFNKSTTTPAVLSGGTATYIIEVTNTSASTAVDVVVTDILAPGFTYSDTVSISGGTRTSTSDPTVGDQVPSWGTFSIASGSTLTITFNAAVAAGIQGTYDNELSAASSNTPVGTFDPLLTTAEDVTVTGVAPPAPFGSLVSTGDISVGCTATLNWTASNATSGTLNPGSISIPVGNGSGSISVTPITTTTYTLTLTGPGGTTAYNATVTVNPAPVITAFSASPTTIAAGDPVTFSATFTGGTGVITPGNYPLASGGTYVLAVGPGVSTVYTLTVTAPCGPASQDTASATVTVGNAPFGSLVSAGDISVGCTATLNWTASNATSGTLNPGGISVPVGNGSGSIPVTPVTTTTYTLTLTGPGGTTAYNATVTVNPAPVITAFSASPATINAGDPVTFSATFTGGIGIITPGNYPITSGGTYVLATGPGVSTVYTLTVTAPCGPASQDTASVTVPVGNAPTGSLVSTGDISVGCTATLNWTANNATSGILDPGNIPVPVGNGSGGISVTPTTTTTYTLTLTGPGGTTPYNATVTVNPAPVITSFSALPTAIDAGDPVTFSATFTGGTGVITPGNYSITSGGTYVLAVGPSTSTIFTLTVTAPCGPASQAAASLTVTVGGNPPTGSLRSSGAISAGCTATLNWTANDATSGTLNPGNISVPVENGSGSISVTPTTTYTYTLTLSGPGGTISYNATVTVNPAPVIIDFTATPAAIVAGDAVTFSANFTGGNGVITPGDYPITSGGTYVLTTGPSSTTVYTLTVTAPCGSASRDRAQTTVKVISNRLDALKSAADVNGGNLMPGDEILYSITIISPNDEDLAGIEFSDAIPANTTYVEGSAAGPTGSSIVVTDNTLYFSNITVPARGQVILIFKVRVNDPVAPDVKEISNQGIVNYDKNGDGENDTQVLTDGDTVLPGQQPTILDLSTGPNFNDSVKSVILIRDKNNDGLISPGDTVRYKIDIINSGDTDANGVVFRDTIPDDTDYVANSVTAGYGTAGYDKSTNQVQWTGNVPAGGSVTITFNVVVHSGITLKTLISNQGTIEYDSNDDGVNDTEVPTDGDPSLPGRQPTEFIVGGISSIPATKTATPVNSVLPTPGDVIRYEIVLNNPTGYLLLGVELVDSIPANTTLVAGSISVPPGAVVVSETPTIRITGISIESFSQAKITFDVLIDPWLGPGIDRIVNQGTINFDSDGDGFNDKGTFTDWNPALPGKQPTVTIITCPVLEVTDTSLEDLIKCAGEINYLIEYTNISAAPAKNVVLKSIYDFKVAFRSAFPAPDPGTDDTWTIGTVEPGQTGSIRLKVKVMYRMPFLHIVPHLVILTSNCDTRQAGTRTYVLGCGPR